MNDLKVGQVLWLRVRYQIDKISPYEHPMLIYKIEEDSIRLIAIDKVSGRTYQLFHPYNHFISHTDPIETVIYEDSYAQLNTIIDIELFDELSKARRTTDLLSMVKRCDVFKRYEDYPNKYTIPEERIVYMTKEEVISLNDFLE